jgi:hypothetical protein
LPWLKTITGADTAARWISPDCCCKSNDEKLRIGNLAFLRNIRIFVSNFNQSHD